MGLIDLFTMNMAERRAAKVVTYQFRVNRYQLWMLCGAVAVLALSGRKAISRNECFDRITANLKARIKMQGYWYGLIQLGCLVEFKRPQYPKASSWGITPLGWRVCEVFEAEMRKIEASYPKSKRVAPRDIIINEGDQPPKGYTFAKEENQRRKEYLQHIDAEDNAKRDRSNGH